MTADIPPPDPRLSGKVQIKQMQEPQSQQRIFSAAELQTMTFLPLKFILPDLVPEGATLLVSRPKLGKSWLVLDVAIATAAGTETLHTRIARYVAVRRERGEQMKVIVPAADQALAAWVPTVEPQHGG